MDLLRRECYLFCRYLIGQRPGEYVQLKYREFHEQAAVEKEMCARPFDHVLLAVARLGPLATQLADGYARIARPTAVLRKKLILMLAILESCAPYHRYLSTVKGKRDVWLLARLALTLTLSGCVFLVAVALLAPLHLLCAAAGAARRWTRAAFRVDGPGWYGAYSNRKHRRESSHVTT